jgi:hypothetical protein
MSVGQHDPFERLLEDGFERLHRQEALKILVDVNGQAA